ncbi:glycoside hydrolase family 9 protein [Aureisphaera galaxeae]|uniref:glycoside hydrolase family 9 protein n=1 Tax=Aureisphaera galaxeae TaxID=1538023 RepID=UPI0023510668|nr:glycoside hydrolase family 9 protein [Aureisphaera galaxeae]MDC8003734.1 glycoside hydrolase family 9 protein [Aureisphaera galaxeae]
MKKLIINGVLMALALPIFSQDISPFIHVDQFGYAPNATKVAVLSNPEVGYNNSESYTPGSEIQLRDASNDNLIYASAVSAWNGGAVHGQSGDSGWWFDFSSVTGEGNYYVYDPTNDERSGTFYISDARYTEVLKTAGRAFYYNRCNAPKDEPYAQGWDDGDNFNNALQDFNCRYIYDPGNASLEKDLSGGWFDAGDYNKYVTFTHSTLHNLLWAYEEHPDAFDDNWNIPESGNGIPDLIDEIKWELDWLLKMVNSDGSVHIKMGSQNFAENSASPPSANTDPRFYGPTCSSASITIASVMAHAAKVFGQFPEFQAYATTLEQTAISTYNYAKTFVDAGTLETDCDDGSIVAGDADQPVATQLAFFFTASVHLFDITGASEYNDYVMANVSSLEQIDTDFWGPYFTEVNDALIYYTLLPGADSATINTIVTSWLATVNNDWNDFFGFSENDLYRAQMPDWSYHWGSNQAKSGYGVINLLAKKSNFFPASNDEFDKQIDEILHYFHGVNPQGMVYLSNMYSVGADRSANEIYHTWFADGTVYDNAITSPIGPAPGFVSGGPNAQFSVTSLVPPYGQPQQKSYLDFNDGFPNNSWEITEPAIYYQASYIRLLAARTDASLVLSIEDNFKSQTIVLAPNPANDSFEIRGIEGPSKLQLHTVTGQFLSERLVVDGDTINIEQLPPGIYFVTLASDQGKVTQKIIVE